MATRTRIQPLDRSFELSLRADLDPAQRSRQFAAFAEEEIDKASEENRVVLGRTVPRKVFVDGREGAPLDQVQPTGTITAVFELVEDVLIWIGEELRRTSPVLSGEYRRSHIMLADGVEFDPTDELPRAQEYVFISTSPYARKLEGVSPKKPASKSAPDGVYEVVAALAARRFGNIAKVSYGWRSLHVSKGAKSDRQPAIFVEVP